jgi:RNA polymerase sigma-70 factor, ECF subfamily
MNPTTSDQTIRDGLAANDSSVLALIWDVYANDLFAYLVGMLRSREEAEDVVQDLFVAIARKRHVLAKADCLKAYLFTAARNLALNRLKKRDRALAREAAAENWLEPRDERHDADRREAVQSALAELPTEQRSVIVMKFFRAKSFREIAELLGISENTAGSRYRYGMGKLRTLLREGGR